MSDASATTQPPAPEPPLAVASWLAAIGVMVAGNVLLIVEVGHWLTVSGSLALLLAASLARVAPRGATAFRRRAYLLLALTLLNFNGWAFSHLGNLLGFLGLYFFALFGLVQGATLRQVFDGHAIATPRRRPLAIAAVVVTWIGGLTLESAYLPADAHRAYVTKIQRLSGGETLASIAERIPAEVRGQLRERFGVAGLVGYLAVAFRDGEVRFDVPDREREIVYRLRHRGWIFGVRLALSLALLFYGVLTLAAPRPRRAAARAAVLADRPGAPHSHSMVAGGFDEMS